MKSFEQKAKWMKSICEEKPHNFASYLLEDIKAYLNLDGIDENNLKAVCGSKYISLLRCKTKEEVRNWINNITSYVIMKMDTEAIIADYLN